MPTTETATAGATAAATLTGVGAYLWRVFGRKAVTDLAEQVSAGKVGDVNELIKLAVNDVLSAVRSELAVQQASNDRLAGQLADQQASNDRLAVELETVRTELAATRSENETLRLTVANLSAQMVAAGITPARRAEDYLLVDGHDKVVEAGDDEAAS